MRRAKENERAEPNHLSVKYGGRELRLQERELERLLADRLGNGGLGSKGGGEREKAEARHESPRQEAAADTKGPNPLSRHIGTSREN